MKFKCTTCNTLESESDTSATTVVRVYFVEVANSDGNAPDLGNLA